MNIRFLMLAVIAALIFAFPSLSFAGKKNKAIPAPLPPNPAMLKYDRNADGTLDAAEKEAITSTYGEIAVWDKDKDGRISEEELAEIAKPPAPPAEAPKKKKKKNK